MGVSIVGSNNSVGSLPAGVTLGAINYGANGVDDVVLMGNPTEAGSYPLNLIVTDNNGALLTQPFNLSVSENNYSLPDAIANQPYSQNIPIGYNNDNAIVNFSAWKNNLQSSDIFIQFVRSSIYNGTATLQLTPYKTGQFTIEADVVINNTVVNTETFKLNVDSPVITTPVVAPQTTSQIIAPPIVTQPPVVMQLPVETQPSVVKPQHKIQISNPSPTPTIKPTPTAITIVQGTAQTQPTSTTAKNQNKSNASNNIFSNILNFVKNIFK